MRKLGIEVYWQTNQGHTIDDDVLVTKRPISSINLSEYPISDGSPSNRLIIENTTDLTHPLPNRNLLGMQWHLNRVVALYGVSEAAELEDDTDEEAEGTA
jgi:hypothetical protein